MNSKQVNLICKPLRSFVAAISICAIFLSFVTPAMAAETTATTQTENISDVAAETTVSSVTNEDTAELLTYLRNEIAAYMERYQLSAEMPDSALANAYFVLDSDGAKAAWDTANELLAKAQELRAEDAGILRGEKNTLLCLRFYDIMVQINNPTMIKDDLHTVTPAEGRNINVNVNYDDNNNEISSSSANNTVTVTVKSYNDSGCGGQGWLSRKVTITVSNPLTEAAMISFDWNVVWADTAGTIFINDSSTGSTTSGNVPSVRVEASSTYTWNLVVETYKGESSATITLSNFQSVEPPKSANLTFVHDPALGSITVGGKAIEAETSEPIPVGEAGIAVSAEAKSGATFLGWMDTTSHFLYSTKTSDTILPTESDTTVQAVFLDNTSTTGWYLTSESYLFNDLNAASEFAATQSIGKIILLNNAVLPEGNYTIYNGVTLLIPFDDNHTIYQDSPEHDNHATWVQPTAFRTLTMTQNAKITVASGAAISLSAKHHAGATGGPANKANGGSPTGAVSFIKMNTGSKITVQGGGNLYAWGYITGSGSVEVQSGGTVYENFQLNDFRGGSHTSWASSASRVKKVFPINSYYVQNIEVPLTLYAGASEICYSSLYASTAASTSANFIASSGAMFNLTDGYLTKKYDGKTDRLILDFYGTGSLSPLSLSLGGYGIDSSGYNLPINSNITVNVHSGKVSIEQSLALLPGAVVTIDNGAEVSVSKGKNIYVYDSDQWLASYLYPSTARFHPLAYAPGRTYNRTDSDLKDAAVLVNGTLTATEGAIYTTSPGYANIYSTGTGVVNLIAGTETNTYQVTKLASNMGFTPGTTTAIPITPANLKNADGTYVATAAPEDGYGAGTYTYSKADGVWHKWNGTKCEICELFKICGTSVKAGDALDIFFYVDPKDFPDYKSGAYKAEITRTKLKEVNGVYTTEEETKIADPIPSSAWVENQNLLRFSYNGIAAKEMMDIVTVKIVDSSGKQVSQTITESIEGYATRALQKLENTNGLHTTLVDMLNYGALAQKYFGYRADNLANASLSDAQKQLATPSVSYENSTSSNSAATYPLVAASVTAGNYVHMTFYFTNITDLTGFTAEISYTDHYGSVKGTLENPIIINGSEFDGPRKTQDGRIVYGPTVKNLAIADGRQDITCVLKRDGTIIDTVTSSVESYIAETIKYNPSDAVLIELCENLLKFTDSAYAYFHPGI